MHRGTPPNRQERRLIGRVVTTGNMPFGGWTYNRTDLAQTHNGLVSSGRSTKLRCFRAAVHADEIKRPSPPKRVDDAPQADGEWKEECAGA